MKNPHPFVPANFLLSFTVASIPLNTPLKYPRPEGSVVEPSGKVGLRTRVNSFDDDCPLRKNSVLQVRVYVLFLDINVMVFRKACTAAVETVGCQRRSQQKPICDNPSAASIDPEGQKLRSEWKFEPQLALMSMFNQLTATTPNPRAINAKYFLHHSSFDRLPEHAIGGTYRHAYFVPRTG